MSDTKQIGLNLFGQQHTIGFLSAVIAHDILGDRRFDAWWNEQADRMGGFVGLYDEITDLAIAIENEERLEQAFVYDLAIHTAAYLFTPVFHSESGKEFDIPAIVEYLVEREAAEEARIASQERRGSQS